MTEISHNGLSIIGSEVPVTESTPDRMLTSSPLRDVSSRVRAFLPALFAAAMLSAPLMSSHSDEAPATDALSVDLDEDGLDDSRAFSPETAAKLVVAVPIMLVGCAGPDPSGLGPVETPEGYGEEEEKKESDDGGGWNPIEKVKDTIDTMAQTLAILLVLVTGFGPRLWKGKGPIQSGVSIVASGILFVFYWTAFGLVSLATPVAGVMAGWEPTMWLIKKIGKHGNTPPATP